MFACIYDVDKFLLMPVVHHTATLPTNYEKTAEHRKHINMLALKGVVLKDRDNIRCNKRRKVETETPVVSKYAIKHERYLTRNKFNSLKMKISKVTFFHNTAPTTNMPHYYYHSTCISKNVGSIAQSICLASAKAPFRDLNSSLEVPRYCLIRVGFVINLWVSK